MAKRKIKIKKNKIGAVLLVGLFGLLFFILVLRFSYIMITGHSNGQDLIMKANQKYLVNNQEQPERGKIYDRNGKVLAEDVERYKVVAVVDKKASENSKKPRHVVDKKKTAKELSKIIDMKPDEIEKRLNQKKAFQVEFGQKGTDLTYQDKEKLEKKNYVVRTREEKDERNLQISLTDHGKSIKKPLSEVSLKVFGEFDIDVNEAKELINHLQMFVSKNFDKSTEK